MGRSQPFMYNNEQHDNPRFSTSTFDPKAVTRASWEPKPARPRQTGPLVSLNLHPDAHVILPNRNLTASLGSQSKRCIKWFRRVQLFNRLLELNGALGILVLMILMTKVSTTTGWVLRIASGIVALHCFYAVYHLSRSATGRTPASSAAYQFFAISLDLFSMCIYGFGAFEVKTKADGWSTRLSDQSLMKELVPALYYIMVGSGGLHVVSLGISLWLGWVFRKISLMPPDMNPLEDHLTARPSHKRNKSSIATSSTAESEKRASIQSGVSGSRPSSMPFMHTREQSRSSVNSYSPQLNLPSRQYQILTANPSRESVVSRATESGHRMANHQRAPYSRLSMSDIGQQQRGPNNHNASPTRAARFTEAWIPTDSLISRTNQKQRQRTIDQAGHHHVHGSKSYSALEQRYNMDDSSDSEYEDENQVNRDNVDTEHDLGDGAHPNPLRSNPTTPPRQNTPWKKTTPRPWTSSNICAYSPLSELGSNERLKQNNAFGRQSPTVSKNISERISRLRAQDDFASRSYGDAKSATPPVMVGEGRKVSSGNDFGMNQTSIPYGRRNVSGKIAEEGLARGNPATRW